MAFHVIAGWDIAELGSATLTLGEGVDTAPVSLTSGKYCHVDISTETQTPYDDFATALKTALDAASPNSRTYTVAYDYATFTYTIEVNTGTFYLQFGGSGGTRMRKLLGISGNTSAAATATSDIIPWYHLWATNEGISDVSDEYEPQGAAEEDENDAGFHDGVAWDAMPTYYDFTIPNEPKDKTFEREVETSPGSVTTGEHFWTWQHFFKHCRNVHPFLTVNTDTSENMIHFLRADSSHFRPRRKIADYDAYWDIDFNTRLVANDFVFGFGV